MTKILSTLTAPGLSETIDIKQYKTNVFDIEVANIDDSITFSLETSNDKQTWTNIADDNEVFTVISNGVERIIVTQDLPIEFVRINWLTETGGTNATVVVKHVGLL